MRRGLTAVTTAALLAVGLSGCGAGSGSTSERGRTLVVLVGPSLSAPFEKLADDFRADHPGVKVVLVRDSERALAGRAIDGAPGDVLVTSDQATMDRVRRRHGTSGTPVRFAGDVIQLVVPGTGSGRVRRVADLRRARVRFAACTPSAPCGVAADSVLKAGRVRNRPTVEADSAAVLARVAAGRAAAGLAFRADVRAAGPAVTGIDLSGPSAGAAASWIALTRSAGEPGLARKWIALVTSSVGRRVFAEAGYVVPTR